MVGVAIKNKHLFVSEHEHEGAATALADGEWLQRRLDLLKLWYLLLTLSLGRLTLSLHALGLFGFGLFALDLFGFSLFALGLVGFCLLALNCFIFGLFALDLFGFGLLALNLFGFGLLALDLLVFDRLDWYRYISGNEGD